ncbi:CBS domain-containing protein [Roseateles albus]|uniref:CBS domain-containing protein n=1 Tax=Roseateles albus TaxID=2987525 RepID=A0ABT5KHH0_9BURK|nr:CBS domain-containing protein [Roseateles albus]MDC8773382.1 CBS domain-containing protein [Roseateles albus]
MNDPELKPEATRSVAQPAVSAIQAVARSRLLTVPVDAHLVNVAALLSSAQISVVVVCSETGEVLGIITETMLVKQLGMGRADFFSTRADAVMTRDIRSCGLQDLLPDVLTMMHKQGLIHVLLVDADNRPLGVVNMRDGLRALLQAGNHEEELLRSYVMGIGYQ